MASLQVSDSLGIQINDHTFSLNDYVNKITNISPRKKTLWMFEWPTEFPQNFCVRRDCLNKES